MFMSLTWSALVPGTEEAVRLVLEREIKLRPFENYTEPLQGVILATVRNGYEENEVIMLSYTLNSLAAGFFQFIATVSDQGRAIQHSADLKADFRRVFRG